MTTEPLAEPRMRERLTRLRAELDAAPLPRRPGEADEADDLPAADLDRRPAAGRSMSGPLVLAIESSCDETGIAIVEGGRRIHANVVASQVALHAATGGHRPGGGGPSPPALDRAGPRRGVGRRRRDVGRHRRGAVTYGPGSGRIAARRHQLREGPRLGPRQAAGRREPPRGPRLRGVAARPGRGRARRTGVPARRARRVRRPHLPRRDARPPDLPAARPDRRRRRGRGVRQGRAAARPRLPGRTGDPARGRGGDRAATASSRGPGSATRTTSASPGSRPRRAGSSTRRAPRPGSPTTPDAPLPDDVVAELAWGFQDAVVDVLATKTIRAARRGRRPLDRARRRRCGQRRAARAGWPARRRRSGCR